MPTDTATLAPAAVVARCLGLKNEATIDLLDMFEEPGPSIVWDREYPHDPGYAVAVIPREGDLPLVRHRNIVAMSKKLEREGLHTGGLTSTDVAGFFGSRCGGVPSEELEGDTVAPVAMESFAPIPVAGDLPEPQLVTPDEQWPGNRYEWFDFEQVQPGGCVYRISCTLTWWFFHRGVDGAWQCAVFEG